MSRDCSFYCLIRCRSYTTSIDCFKHGSPGVIRKLRSKFWRCRFVGFRGIYRLFLFVVNLLCFQILIFLLIRFFRRSMLSGRGNISLIFLLLLSCFWLGMMLSSLRLVLFSRLINLFFDLLILLCNIQFELVNIDLELFHSCLDIFLCCLSYLDNPWHSGV